MILIQHRNDFLEHSRYAKIAYHVASTMETVNLNEMSKEHELYNLVRIRKLTTTTKKQNEYPFAFFSARLVHCE